MTIVIVTSDSCHYFKASFPEHITLSIFAALIGINWQLYWIEKYANQTNRFTNL